MRGGIRVLVAATATAAALVVTVSAGAGSQTTCNGQLASGSYQKVVVPDGAVCMSDGPININGGLWIGRAATFVLGNEETPGDNGHINGGVHATNGGVTIDGYNGFWMGFIRNTVNGGVNLNNNVLVDPDGNEYVTNHINGGLNCSGNSPAPQVGDSEGSPNIVNGRKTGQCAGL